MTVNSVKLANEVILRFHLKKYGERNNTNFNPETLIITVTIQVMHAIHYQLVKLILDIK